MSKYDFFRDNEIKGLNDELMQKLVAARRIANAPFVITSGLRTPEQNQSADGVQDSSHLEGLAVDLRAKDSTSRFKIIKALLAVGFTRIGVYAKDGHIHVDCDSSKPSNVLWVNE